MSRTSLTWRLLQGLRTRASRSPAAVAIVALTAAVWLPFGLGKTALMEEWSYYKFLDEGQPMIGADGIRDHTTRPFLIVGFGLGHWLTPDSFVGLNILNLVLFLGKGLVAYALMRRLFPQNRPFALVTAAVFLVHPADVSLFELRVTNYHLATLLLLVAVWLLLVYWKRPHPLTLLAMWSSLLVGLGTSEVAYPLVLLAPALLWVAPGGPNARFARVAVLWYAVPVGFLAWMAPRLAQPGNYVAGAFDQAFGGEGVALGVASVVGRAYLRNLFTCWAGVAHTFGPLALYGAITAAAAAAVGYAAWRERDGGRPDHGPMRYAGAAAVGLVVIGLGFLPFAFSYARTSNERVFLLSSIGAAVTLTSLLWLASRRARYAFAVFVVAGSLATGVGTLLALERHRRVIVGSLREQRILAGFAREMPRLVGEPLVVLYDRFGQFPIHFESSWASSGILLSTALQYFYRDPRLMVFLCYPDGRAGGIHHDACAFRENDVFVSRSGYATAAPYDRLLVLRLTCDGDVKLMRTLPIAPRPGYRPDAHIDRTAPPPARVHTVLSSWPFRRIPTRLRVPSCGTPSSPYEDGPRP